MNHLYGKTKRFATSILPIDENRNGECRNCGACCKFLFKCPFLISDANGSNGGLCSIYEIRPPQCRKYPRTKDEQMHEPCGYCFADGYSGNKSGYLNRNPACVTQYQKIITRGGKG